MGTNLPDQLLVERVLRGHANAFGEIIKNTEGLVAQIVFKMISNADDRRDISQDIYLKAFRNLQGFRFQSKLSTWIGQIAYNTCLNYLEKKKLLLAGDPHELMNKADEALANFSESEIEMDKKQVYGILQSAVENLPPVYKTLITLYHQEELSYEEIAEIMQMPQGTIKNYLFRARRILKQNLLASYKREEL